MIHLQYLIKMEYGFLCIKLPELTLFNKQEQLDQPQHEHWHLYLMYSMWYLLQTTHLEVLLISRNI